METILPMVIMYTNLFLALFVLYGIYCTYNKIAINSQLMFLIAFSLDVFPFSCIALWISLFIWPTQILNLYTLISGGVLIRFTFTEVGNSESDAKLVFRLGLISVIMSIMGLFLTIG